MVDRKQEKISSRAEDARDEVAELFREQMIRDMELDQSYTEFPSPLRREWAIAQGHLLEKQGLTEAEKKTLQEEREADLVEEELAEMTYDKVMGQLSTR